MAVPVEKEYTLGGILKMKRLFSFKRIRQTHYDNEDGEIQDDYVQLDTDVATDPRSNKVLVQSFSMEDFSDIKQILDVLREGYTICLINIKPLKEKDLVELKRAINKLKKTCEAIDGDIAGFGDDYIVVTPSFASIKRSGAGAQLPE